MRCPFLTPPARLVSVLALSCFALAACRSTYYALWETFGREKRDLLKSNVQAAREEQQETSEQFKDALTRLKELYGFEGGNLEKTYNALNRDYERCSERADNVRSRVKKVETIAGDLFKEWEVELKSISNDNLRASSHAKLDETRSRYYTMEGSMKKAERSMEPVLTLFRDHVLYLKHNLNAQAIGSLRGEAAGIETEVAKLIEDMNASIVEADRFIQTLP